MRVQVVDEGALRAVRSVDLAAYLRASGWIEQEPDDPVTVWSRDDVRTGEVIEVLAPKQQHWRDYGRRVQAVLETLAEVEERSQLAILRDVSETSTDVVRLAAIGGDARGDGTIPLEDGVRLGSSIGGMLLAAACAAVQPKRAFPPRKPRKATDYMSAIRLAQTERGSYVVSVLSRVTPAMEIRQLELALQQNEFRLGDEPYARSVVRTLATALDLTRKAAGRAFSSGTFEAFIEAVEFGVSADLCEALAELQSSRQASAFNIDVTWAPVRPGPQSVARSTSFGSDELEVIRDAGRLLRENTPIEDFEVEGPVVDLSRPEDLVSGDAQVFTYVEGVPRLVNIELSGNAWKVAYDAFGARSIFRCEGELIRSSKPYRLKNARGVSIRPRDPTRP